MLHTLVVGLGRSGAGLHLPVLTRLRAAATSTPSRLPIVACDPWAAVDPMPGVRVVRSPAQAAGLLPPERTVTHLCTPPGTRAQVLADLVSAGFRRFIVEKPLAAHRRELGQVDRLRERYGLDLVVVAPWLAAGLTRRLAELAGGGELGALRSITVHQHKPRFHRTLTNSGHPTAFDVEIPHALPVVLRLAGPAELADAGWTAMSCGAAEIPRLGGARLVLRHANGVRSTLSSNLMSPARRRQVTLRLEHGTVTGYYPLSQEDDHAQLSVQAGGRREHQVFRDDALAAFFEQAYAHFHRSRKGFADDLELHRDSVRLLNSAKRQCEAAAAVTPELPVQQPRVSDHVG